MSNEVLNFLTKLATEPQVFSDFLQDPSAVLQREGIDEKVQRALLSGDPTRVHAAVRGEASAYEAAYENSLNNVRVILNILATDPTAAAWMCAYYAQAIQWGLPGYGAGSPVTATAGMPQTTSQ
jgi:hypothetical protein